MKDDNLRDDTPFHRLWREERRTLILVAIVVALFALIKIV